MAKARPQGIKRGKAGPGHWDRTVENFKSKIGI